MFVIRTKKKHDDAGYSYFASERYSLDKEEITNEINRAEFFVSYSDAEKRLNASKTKELFSIMSLSFWEA